MAFLRWQSVLEPAVEVCAVELPGHGTRLREPLQTCWSDLLVAIFPQIASAATRPFAFFGHSLGGLVAFEMARYCRRRCCPGPACLFISGCSGPRDQSRKDLHLLADDALIEVLREFNGTPPEILANRELMEILLPVIRGDLILAETYQYDSADILDVPIKVLAGSRDPDIAMEQVKGWENETTNGCEIKCFEGDHFFIQTQQKAVIEYVKEVLERVVSG